LDKSIIHIFNTHLIYLCLRYVQASFNNINDSHGCAPACLRCQYTARPQYTCVTKVNNQAPQRFDFLLFWFQASLLHILPTSLLHLACNPAYRRPYIYPSLPYYPVLSCPVPSRLKLSYILSSTYTHTYSPYNHKLCQHVPYRNRSADVQGLPP
jgi:hypothetical protein